ncbi:4'-phosphopantetheinyl transferase [Actinomadura sp. NBRC 104425]|uniref:4'-phosphopantetheinyl transferase family protein n=1 Tax=Actinomadura sp. NBRC 104425 TaxID=3032204 RepID=UPI0024A1E686|nr:4'-phosphopantetheinyl transferase superfamily protein [Actinomadura sp. NBRC 104425]GLZ13085.1 4'-phosphopantetheinyl transferase [Actinomadura sp. NBRC 104425]
MEPVTVWWGEPGWAGAEHVALLDPVERGRRDRFLRDADRNRFTLGVAVTRLAVGALRGMRPDRVPISRACADCGKPHGRPVVDGGPHVSVSHSGDRVAVALSPHGPLGVDVEAADRELGADIVRHVLGAAELEASAGGPGMGRDELLTYWTRKEAVVKATGDGLRVPLTDVTVSPAAAPPALLAWGRRPDMPERIAMRTLDPGEGYAAAIALLDHPPGVPVVERSAAELLELAPRR